MTKPYTNEQIMEYRRLWIEFLKQPDTKKATGYLDIGFDRRCCLGHGAFILGIDHRWNRGNEYFVYNGQEQTAPTNMIAMLDLHDEEGGVDRYYDGPLMVIDGVAFHSLAALNDSTNWTPQQIGAYLDTVIEGGPNTPFRKLD